MKRVILYYIYRSGCYVRQWRIKTMGPCKRVRGYGSLFLTKQRNNTKTPH